MIGVDILEIDRIKSIAEDEQKLKKIFTKNEIEYFNKFKNKYERICGHFCAKEAVKKAFFCPKELSFLDIEILHNNDNSPYVLIKNKKNENIHISISHSKRVCVAFCLIEDCRKTA